jgi:hypothetical protein
MSGDFEQVMAQCSRGCFTGLLRVRTRDGNGEVRFLSGIQDGVRFDSIEGDAALERLLAASEPEFEAIASLPPIDFSSTEPVPPEGGLDRYHAAQLMRYCETNSLTCALELEVKGRVLTARYRLGELLSVEPDSEHTARLAEAKEGLYRFRLPRFELPANVQQRRSVPAPAKPSAAPVAARPAPAPVAAKPAPVPVATRPAPAPIAAKPAPAAAKQPTPASLAETPLVAMKPVAIVTPTAGPVAGRAPRAPAQGPASPPLAAPAATPPKVAAAGSARPTTEARPAPSPARGPAASVPPLGSASPARPEGPRLGPSAVTPQPGRGADRAAAAQSGGARPGGAARQQPAAHASASSHPPAAPAPHAPAAPTSRPPAPRSPVPSSPPSAPPPPVAQAKPAPLQGLWADAVKPPPQSAPIELDGALRGGGASKPLGRAEGLSSLAYTPTDVPAVAPPRGRSSAGYWFVAIAVLILVAAAGWFAFGR